MMNGEALMVLLEWTIYGFCGENKQGLPASQSRAHRPSIKGTKLLFIVIKAIIIIKTWLADRSFWQSWVEENEPHQRLLTKNVKWVCMKEEPVWGNEVVNERLTAALEIFFSGQTVAALEFTALSQQSREIPLMYADLPNKQCPARTAAHDQ